MQRDLRLKFPKDLGSSLILLGLLFNYIIVIMFYLILVLEKVFKINQKGFYMNY